MPNDTLKSAIERKSGGRGGRIIVSAGGQVFKGTIASASDLGEDYFTLEGLSKLEISKAEGAGMAKINIPYAAVQW